jgi:hypothetical protein
MISPHNHTSRHQDCLREVFASISALLISRASKERQETVKLDVLTCLTLLLDSSLRDCLLCALAKDSLSFRAADLVKDCCKELEGGSLKVKSAVLTLLAPLQRLLGSAPPSVLESCVRCLLDKSHAALKVEVLEFLHCCLESGQAGKATVQSLVPCVCACALEDWARVSAEALRVLGLAIQLLPEVNLLAQISGVVIPRLMAIDVDVDIKEAAISTASKVVIAGVPNSTVLLDLLYAKVENDTTRISALRALTSVCSAGVDVSGIAERLVATLGPLLRLHSRIVREAALSCLTACLGCDSAAPSPPTLLALTRAVSALIEDPALDNVTAMGACRVLGACQRFPCTTESVGIDAYPHLLRLASASSTHEATRDAICAIIKVFISLSNCTSAVSLMFRSSFLKVRSILTVC